MTGRFNHPHGLRATSCLYDSLDKSSSLHGWRSVTDEDVDRESQELLERGHPQEAVKQAAEWMKAFLQGLRP